jgi:hypothetical protein
LLLCPGEKLVQLVCHGPKDGIHLSIDPGAIRRKSSRVAWNNRTQAVRIRSIS